MNVMLDPRMVAASTHGAARFEQSVSAEPARITASSHGALAMVVKLFLPLLFSILDCAATHTSQGLRGPENKFVDARRVNYYNIARPSISIEKPFNRTQEQPCESRSATRDVVIPLLSANRR
jgi:hypothetical protein